MKQENIKTRYWFTPASKKAFKILLLEQDLNPTRFAAQLDIHPSVISKTLCGQLPIPKQILNEIRERWPGFAYEHGLS